MTAENETAIQVYNNFWRGRRMFCKFRTLVIVPPLLPPNKKEHGKRVCFSEWDEVCIA